MRHRARRVGDHFVGQGFYYRDTKGGREILVNGHLAGVMQVQEHVVRFEPPPVRAVVLSEDEIAETMRRHGYP